MRDDVHQDPLLKTRGGEAPSEGQARHSFILTVNAGSSSIKFSLFGSQLPLERLLSGRIERIGLPESRARTRDATTGESEEWAIDAPDHAACLGPLLEWLGRRVRFTDVVAVGHRVVHGGMLYNQPQRVTAGMLKEMERLGPYNPGHFPAQVGLIEAFSRHCPDLTQVACFDTAFHRDLPRVARLLPLPRRYDAAGIHRYGFHGLSYAFLMNELERLGGRDHAHGRIILAHLGNGASMAAVRDGRSVDTTMAFTPTAGLVMSTRTGDLDPGIYAYLARTEGMTADRFQTMINNESGLLGVSETGSDMRDLLAREAHDPRAAEAVALFCYQAKKWVGALTAALGGLDTLVFTGGIGENAAEVRARICQGLGFLGIEIDPARNDAGQTVISTPDARVTVRVIKTDEEVQIARDICELLTRVTAPRG